jgi:hypothetical protein
MFLKLLLLNANLFLLPVVRPPSDTLALRSAATAYALSSPCFNGSTLVNLTFAWAQVMPPASGHATLIGSGTAGVFIAATQVATDAPAALAAAPQLPAAVSTLLIPAYALRTGRTYIVRVNMTANVSSTGAAVTGTREGGMGEARIGRCEGRQS